MNTFLRRIGLRFDDPSQEREFLEYYVLRRRVAVQFALLGGSGIFYMFFVWDKSAYPAHWDLWLSIRGLLLVPTLWVFAGLIQISLLRKYLEYIVTLAIIIGVIGTSFVDITLVTGFDYETTGMILVVMFCVALIPIRFPFFVAFAVAALAVFFIYDLFWAKSPTDMIVTGGLCLGTAVLFGTASMIWRERAARAAFVMARQCEASRAQVSDLLHSILPDELAYRIEMGETSAIEAYAEVSIVFANVLGLADLARRVRPARLLQVVKELYARFDEQAGEHGLARARVGDTYLAVGGLSGQGLEQDHARKAAVFALAIRSIVGDLSSRVEHPLTVRMGLHVGPAIAGVIAANRPAFDCWGDAVDLASQLASSAEPGAIMISETAFWRLRDAFSIRDVDGLDPEGVGPGKSFLLQSAAGGQG